MSNPAMGAPMKVVRATVLLMSATDSELAAIVKSLDHETALGLYEELRQRSDIR